MPFLPSFSVSQTPLNPAIVTVNDTSTGSDPAITSRVIYFIDAEGNYIVPTGTLTSYVDFPIIVSTIDIDLLQEDTALDVRIEWLNVLGSVIYTITQTYCFAQYTKDFLYYLVQLQGLTPSVVSDSNYDSNLALLWTSVRGAINAIEIANDLAGSQNCLDRCTYYSLNQSKFF